MCRYDAVFGSGEVLVVQIATLAAIAGSIMLWAWIYKRFGVGLKKFAVPLVLWIVFGTLDITITARGTTIDPLCEGNSMARFLFVTFGAYGPPIASALWIAFWAGLVLLLNQRKAYGAEFLSLAIFYCLGVGHMFGFSSWFGPMCWIRRMEDALPYAPFVIGCLLAGLHLLARKWRSSQPQKSRKGL